MFRLPVPTLRVGRWLDRRAPAPPCTQPDEGSLPGRAVVVERSCPIGIAVHHGGRARLTQVLPAESQIRKPMGMVNPVDMEFSGANVLAVRQHSSRPVVGFIL